MFWGLAQNGILAKALRAPGSNPPLVVGYSMGPPGGKSRERPKCAALRLISTKP